MPHIILEYSKNIGDVIDVSKLVPDLHHTLAEQGIDPARIKARATSCDYIAVNEHGSHGHMLHLTLLLLEGRDAETKRAYGDALRAVMVDYVGDAVRHCSITLEIRDMRKDSYFM